MSKHNRLIFNMGVAATIALAEQTADIIAAEGDMAGARDTAIVEALRTFAREAADLYRALPTAIEEA